MPLNNPIATIVDSYNNCDNSIQLSLPNELITYLNECTDSFDTTFVFSSSKSELKKIISSVRNKILEWALILEENGITGEGLSFSEEEKTIARTAEVINNYTNNFYGDANNTQVDQGTK